MKPSEPQFTPEQQNADAIRADHWGFRIGQTPGLYTVKGLQKAAEKGTFTPISGDALTQGVKSRKLGERNEERFSSDVKKTLKRNKEVLGSGVIQGGKLVKGGNSDLRNSLDEKNNK